MLIENTLRYLPRFSRVVAFLSKIDAKGNTPRSLAKAFSRTRSYVVSARYDVNDFARYAPDSSSYDLFFKRARAPHYTPFRPAFYPAAKVHFLANDYRHHSVFSWGHSDDFTFSRLKKIKKGFILFARAGGCAKFAFFFRTVLGLRPKFQLLPKKGLKFKKKRRSSYRYPFNKLLRQRVKFVQAARLRTWRSLLKFSLSPLGPSRKRVRFTRSIFRRLRRRLGRSSRFSRSYKSLPVQIFSKIFSFLSFRRQRASRVFGPSSFRLCSQLLRMGFLRVKRFKAHFKFFIKKFKGFFRSFVSSNSRGFVRVKLQTRADAGFNFLRVCRRNCFSGIGSKRFSVWRSLYSPFLVSWREFYGLSKEALFPVRKNSDDDGILSLFARFFELCSKGPKFFRGFFRNFARAGRRYTRVQSKRGLVHFRSAYFFFVLVKRIQHYYASKSKRKFARLALFPLLTFFDKHFRNSSSLVRYFFDFQLYSVQYVHTTPGRFFAPISSRYTTLAVR